MFDSLSPSIPNGIQHHESEESVVKQHTHSIPHVYCSASNAAHIKVPCALTRQEVAQRVLLGGWLLIGFYLKLYSVFTLDSSS